MKRRNNKAIIILVALFAVVIIGYLALYNGYQQSLQGSGVRAQTAAAVLHETAIATLTR